MQLGNTGKSSIFRITSESPFRQASDADVELPD
jgi:hypothetical protein